MRRLPTAAVHLLVFLLAFTPAAAQTTRAGSILPPPFRPPPAADIINDENLLLVEVRLDQRALTDAMSAYQSPDGLLIPIEELSRLLDVDLTVQLGEGRVVGTIGEARRPVLVDFTNGFVRVAATTQLFMPGDMVIGATDIYVSPYLLEKILPVRVKFEPEALRLSIVALEPLPIQSRLQRLAKLRGLQSGGGGVEDVYRIKTPARLFSLPSVDVSIDAGGQKRTPNWPFNYDLRAGGDLLFSNFMGFLGSDDKGKPVSARATIERRDAAGRALGPLGLTRVAAGDIFTPSLPLGAQSLGGRGISFSNAPLSQESVFGRIDLRGELPLGYDVELYVNDVLRSGQSTPVQGRYEFRDVPLTRGINIIRIVAYGPRGERSEEVKVVNVGGGQVEKGKLIFDFGAAQQQKSLINLSDDDSSEITAPGVGDLRVTLNLLYGLSETLTLAGGFANYSPTGLDERKLVTTGIRTSIRGIAAQVDLAADDRHGGAAAVALAGRLDTLSVVVRHAEYRRGFVDETLSRGGGGLALTRSSEADFDWQFDVAGRVIPLSMRMSRDQFANGNVGWNGLFRASTALGGLYLSTGFDFNRLETAQGTTNQLNGVLTASSFALFKWQLRASLDYMILPKPKLRAFALTADRAISERTAVRLALGQSFSGGKESTVQASLIRRLGFADMSLLGQYSTRRNDWRIGVQFAFSLVPQPFGGMGYTLARPGAASGGNLALQAFLDRNGNGRYDAGEEPVPGVALGSQSNEKILTDDKGRALVTGLGYGSIAQVRTNMDDVALDNASGPPSVIEITPRAGTIAVVPYPIQSTGEVMLRIFVQRGDKRVGLSAVMVQAIGENGEIREGITEYDGSILFDGLRSGTYRLELAEEQARRLKMRLAEPVGFTVPGDGGAAPDVEALVAFDHGQ